LAQRDVASVQRAEEAQRDEDVARADLAVAEADVAVIRAQGMDAAALCNRRKTCWPVTADRAL
jgi:HlyD family secretion protein